MAIVKQCKICALAIMFALEVSECGEGGGVWLVQWYWDRIDWAGVGEVR